MRPFKQSSRPSLLQNGVWALPFFLMPYKAALPNGTCLQSPERAIQRLDYIVPYEMAGDGLTAPAVAIIRGSIKYIHCETDPPLMFDRANDPHETKT